jgi:phosphoglycerate dehydrogenase-like enzyme
VNVLFAAPENAWGGFLALIRSELSGHHFEATGRFGVDTLKGYDVLIPTMCIVTRQMLMDGDRLKLIQQCGAGLESIDLGAARDLGIRVANVPTDISGNADSVAELGIYFMIGLSRDVRGMARSMAARRMGEPQGRALKGRVVGLVGLGGIGRALIKRLRNFDVRLIGVKRHHPEQAMRALGLEWAGGPGDLEELLSKSDFVILCLPLTPENERLMNADTLSAMKPSAHLINLSRGGLVDRGALEEALATRGPGWTSTGTSRQIHTIPSSAITSWPPPTSPRRPTSRCGESSKWWPRTSAASRETRNRSTRNENDSPG